MTTEELRSAWLSADPADRPLIEAKLKERSSDDDHPYGAVAGGSGGRGGAGGGGRRVSRKDAESAINMLAKDKREHGPLQGARGGKPALRLREPSAGEWKHEEDRFNGFWDRFKDQEKMTQAIQRRAETIKNPQKFYNFMRVLEDNNWHSENEVLEGMFEKKFGVNPWKAQSYVQDSLSGRGIREGRGSDDDHFYGAFGGGGGGKGSGRAAPGSASQMKSAAKIKGKEYSLDQAVGERRGKDAMRIQKDIGKLKDKQPVSGGFARPGQALAKASDAELRAMKSNVYGIQEPARQELFSRMASKVKRGDTVTLKLTDSGKKQLPTKGRIERKTAKALVIGTDTDVMSISNKDMMHILDIMPTGKVKLPKPYKAPPSQYD